MFAIAFDLVVEDILKYHLGCKAGSTAPAYIEIEKTLKICSFERKQGSLYVTANEDMANLFRAIMLLKGLPWFAASVRDIRAFRIEQWSDFTPIIKG